MQAAKKIEGEHKKGKGYFILEYEMFQEFKQALEEIFSPSAAAVILSSAAAKCGKNFYHKIKGRGDKSKEELLKTLSKIKRKEKWGEIYFLDIDFREGSGRIIVKNSFEAFPGDESSCHFLRGFLSGFLSEMFGREVSVEEEKCAGTGEKHCEFVFE